MLAEFGNRGEEPRETSKGLPIVSSDTVSSLWQNYTTRESWGDHLTEVQQRMVRENPNLVKFMESQVGKFPAELHTPVFEILVGTIAVLEHQAEANKLTSSFKVVQPKKK